MMLQRTSGGVMVGTHETDPTYAGIGELPHIGGRSAYAGTMNGTVGTMSGTVGGLPGQSTMDSTSGSGGSSGGGAAGNSAPSWGGLSWTPVQTPNGAGWNAYSNGEWYFVGPHGNLYILGHPGIYTPSEANDSLGPAAAWFASIGQSSGSASSAGSSDLAALLAALQAQGAAPAQPIPDLSSLAQPTVVPTTTPGSNSTNVLLVIIVLAAAGFGFWYYKKHHHKAAA